MIYNFHHTHTYIILYTLGIYCNNIIIHTPHYTYRYIPILCYIISPCSSPTLTAHLYSSYIVGLYTLLLIPCFHCRDIVPTTTVWDALFSPFPHFLLFLFLDIYLYYYSYAISLVVFMCYHPRFPVSTPVFLRQIFMAMP